MRINRNTTNVHQFFRHHVAFVAVLFFFLLDSTTDAQTMTSLICTSLAECVGGDGVSADNTTIPSGRALTCPASDCDGTGILEHHLEDQNLGASAGCTVMDEETGFITTQSNGFIRCFAGVCSTLRNIESVSFRVQRLEGTSTFVTVNLFKGTNNECSSPEGVIALYNQAPLLSVTELLGTGINYLATVEIPGGITLSPTENLLVEIKAPTLVGEGQFFVADSSDLAPPQCDPSYLQSPNCNAIANPTNVATLGSDFAPVSFIITVNTSPSGDIFGPSPTDPATPTDSPPTDTQPTDPLGPSPPILPIPLPSPTPPVSEGCFDSFFSAFGCVFNYLLGWLSPF